MTASEKIYKALLATVEAYKDVESLWAKIAAAMPYAITVPELDAKLAEVALLTPGEVEILQTIYEIGEDDPAFSIGDVINCLQAEGQQRRLAVADAFMLSLGEEIKTKPKAPAKKRVPGDALRNILQWPQR